MKIAIIGAGSVGGALGKIWAGQGHQVMFGSRDPGSEKIRALLAQAGPNAQAGSPAEAVAFGAVVAVALPGSAIAEGLHETGDWTGKIIIDATNRFDNSEGASSAEDIARLTGGRVVKAFNTIGANRYAQPRFGDQAVSMFICGDDSQAKSVVSDLIQAMGFEVVDAGPLSNAGLLEGLARLWVSLARSGYGRDIGFKLLKA